MGRFTSGSRIVFLALATITVIATNGCARQDQAVANQSANGIEPYPEDHEHQDDMLELTESLGLASPFACSKASEAQVEVINEGNAKAAKFVSECKLANQDSPWCDQLVRPNPSSRSTFRCVYGEDQPHRLIHPDEATWQFAFNAVQAIRELEFAGIRVCEVYNWWRPEPYNKSVGGAPGRHPFGTSVDVRFCSKSHANRAWKLLCKMRKAGKIRALGHYESTGLHFGMGDNVANTWGRSCN